MRYAVLWRVVLGSNRIATTTLSLAPMHASLSDPILNQENARTASLFNQHLLALCQPNRFLWIAILSLTTNVRVGSSRPAVKEKGPVWNRFNRFGEWRLVQTGVLASNDWLKPVFDCSAPQVTAVDTECVLLCFALRALLFILYLQPILCRPALRDSNQEVFRKLHMDITEEIINEFLIDPIAIQRHSWSFCSESHYRNAETSHIFCKSLQ